MKRFRVFISKRTPTIVVEANYASVAPSGSLEFYNDRNGTDTIHAFARGHWQNFVEIDSAEVESTAHAEKGEEASK